MPMLVKSLKRQLSYIRIDSSDFNKSLSVNSSDEKVVVVDDVFVDTKTVSNEGKTLEEPLDINSLSN
jgi:hypothetical protein